MSDRDLLRRNQGGNPIPSPAPRAGRSRLAPEQKNEVLEAFDAVVKGNQSLFIQFQMAFQERKQKPGFEESVSGVKGLVKVFLGLFSIPLGKIDFEPLVVVGIDEGGINQDFLKTSHEAIGVIYLKYHHAIEDLLGYREHLKLPLQQVIRAFLTHYVRNKDTYPY